MGSVMMRVPNDEHPTPILVTTHACIKCGKTTELLLIKEHVERWQRGELIQNVWPEWSADQREMLITGIHPACWSAMGMDEEE